MNGTTLEKALLTGPLVAVVVEMEADMITEVVADGVGVMAASSPLHLSLKQQLESHFFVFNP